MTSYVMRPDGSGKPLTADDVKQRFANITRGSDLILVGTPQQVADRIEDACTDLRHQGLHAQPAD
jgi:alkanesulfonate monooxygenase SsuD/methylene tetrahydromethanopterin reductase-like flavin-dependent oxidoreductase (luciferase family)